MRAAGNFWTTESSQCRAGICGGWRALCTVTTQFVAGMCWYRSELPVVAGDKQHAYCQFSHKNATIENKTIGVLCAPNFIFYNNIIPEFCTLFMKYTNYMQSLISKIKIHLHIGAL